MRQIRFMRAIFVLSHNKIILHQQQQQAVSIATEVTAVTTATKLYMFIALIYSHLVHIRCFLRIVIVAAAAVVVVEEYLHFYQFNIKWVE